MRVLRAGSQCCGRITGRKSTLGWVCLGSAGVPLMLGRASKSHGLQSVRHEWRQHPVLLNPAQQLPDNPPCPCPGSLWSSMVGALGAAAPAAGSLVCEGWDARNARAEWPLPLRYITN